MSKPFALRRVSYADHARRVADTVRAPDDAGRLTAAVVQLKPLQDIQTALDQLVRHADDTASGRAIHHAAPLTIHAEQVRSHVEAHRDTLRVAADAADAMIEDMYSQLNALEGHMARHKDDEDPKLTTDGSPHPLQAGGYDPDSDPALPGNISDVEALKEGKTTRKQAEAIAKSDTADAGEPTPSDAAEADDEFDASGKPKPKAKPKAHDDKHKPKK